MQWASGRKRMCLVVASALLMCGACTSSNSDATAGGGSDSVAQEAPSDASRSERVASAQSWLAANAGTAKGIFRSWGGTSATGAAQAILRPDQEKMAVELVATYGDAIEVKLGMFQYPVDKAIPSVCRPVKPSGGDLGDIAAQVSLVGSQASAGADLSGKVVITNSGEFSVQYLASVPLKGVIVRPGTTDVVGNWDGATTGTDLSVSLEPGASKEIDLVVGTASCDPVVGYVVPPGTYDVLVEAFEVRNTLNRVVGNVTVSPSPITIVAAPN